MNNRVLYAEDDHAVRDCVSDVLTQLGWQVTSAADGEAALERFQADEFDVVITDHHMPGRDGLAFVQGLRERCFGGRILVISGGLDEPEREEYERLGVDAIASKPLSLALLRNLLTVA